ncbi:hypothetical protein CONLIGDRAFT_638364 [Coniochaeta ligniaria NRRL 30616]|uniref:Uncharacterized protein n=1 Tax=Coniochaeta ligniaria NRRL 30616 TaxID=1408157 RepID=A0A1J7J4E3_9PEZI|nr:hypothetical protein CONLIGDRAFT_638364 [Coniochaeta ligniaria NRRL 30616]
MKNGRNRHSVPRICVVVSCASSILAAALQDPPAAHRCISATQAQVPVAAKMDIPSPDAISSTVFESDTEIPLPPLSLRDSDDDFCAPRPSALPRLSTPDFLNEELDTWHDAHLQRTSGRVGQLIARKRQLDDVKKKDACSPKLSGVQTVKRLKTESDHSPAPSTTTTATGQGTTAVMHDGQQPQDYNKMAWAAWTLLTISRAADCGRKTPGEPRLQLSLPQLLPSSEHRLRGQCQPVCGAGTSLLEVSQGFVVRAGGGEQGTGHFGISDVGLDTVGGDGIGCARSRRGDGNAATGEIHEESKRTRLCRYASV